MLSGWEQRRGIKDPRDTLRFGGVKFNGIVIAFVGGQIFNGFTGQKAQPEPLLFTQPTRSPYIRFTIRPTKKRKKERAKNRFKQLSLTEDHCFWQMTDILLFQRLGEWVSHIILFILLEHTVPNKQFSSPPIKGIYYSSWVEFSFPLFFCVRKTTPPRITLLISWLRSVLLCRRVKVTSVWLTGQQPSAPRALWNAQTTKRLTEKTEYCWIDRETGTDRQGPILAPWQRKEANECITEGGLWPYWPHC